MSAAGVPFIGVLATCSPDQGRPPRFASVHQHRLNVQDCCVVHSDLGMAADIGTWVTIGHGAVMRGARIADHVMIGMHATVMSGAVIGEGSIGGANSFVPYRCEFPPGCLVVGSPARLLRPLEEAEREHHRIACETYLQLIADYRAGKWQKP